VGTGEATSRASIYVATLSSSLVATGFASGKHYFAPFLACVLVVVLLLGYVTFIRLVSLTRDDLRRMRDMHVIHSYYRRIAPESAILFPEVDTTNLTSMIESLGHRHTRWSIFSSAASLVAIMNATVLGAAAAILGAYAGHGFRAWNVLVGVAAGIAMASALLRVEYVAASTALE
jgi:hypothetical protein